MKFSLSTLAPLAVVFFTTTASSASASVDRQEQQEQRNLQATENPYAPTGDYKPVPVESTCTPENEPSTGESCNDNGLVCGFRNEVQCTCANSSWTCGPWSPLPTPPTAPPVAPPPTCNANDPIDCSGDAYFITKDNNDTVDIEDLDVVADEAEEESSSATTTTAMVSVVLAAAAGAAALVV